MNKKDYNKMIKEVKKIIIDNEGKNTTDGRYQYIIDTKYGKLRISIHKYYRLDKIYSIFTKFEDSEKAKDIFTCNEYTGKCNFHYYKMIDTLNSFIDFIEAVKK